MASAIFLAKVLVVSKRLLLNSFMNSSFHLFRIQTVTKDQNILIVKKDQAHIM